MCSYCVYAHILSKVRNSALNDFVSAYKSAKGRISLLEIQKGGNAPGSWMHEDLALEFARWLNPAFAIWCKLGLKTELKSMDLLKIRILRFLTTLSKTL